MSLDNTPHSDLATLWATRLSDRDLTESETAELHRWLRADPANADALFEAYSFISALRDVPLEKRAGLVSSIAEEPSVPITGWRSRRHVYALAASLVLAAVLTVLFVVSTSGWMPRTYRTHTGETRTVRLPDGSVAFLNARTTVRWSGFTRERRAELVSGEALFEVLHDRTRPFYVRADGSLVRVLGTRFDLNRRRDAIVLTVLEGAVDVRNTGEHGEGPWHRVVSANQRLAYSPTGPLDDVRPVNALKAVHWREGILEFEDETLPAVVEDLSRYTDQPILIGDERLNTQRVTGGLPLHDLRGALLRLESAAPIVVRQKGTGFILERPANPPAGH